MSEPVSHQDGPLTPLEQEAIGLTADLHSLMLRIIGAGPARAGDVAEAVTLIHGLQHMVLAQAAARSYPQYYRLLGE